MTNRLRLVLCAAAVCVLALPAAARAQSVDEIVAKNYAAKGGDKWKAVQTMRLTARINTQGIELPMTIVSKRPNLMRQDMSFQGVSIVQAYDGTTAWSVNPLMGSSEATEVAAPVAESLKEQADFDGPLVHYKEKGHRVELVGTEKLGSTAVYHLKLTKKDGKVSHFYLDTETGVERKVRTQADLGSGPIDIETELSDYQSVDGIMVPMTIRQNAPTGTVSITVDKVEFNVPLDDAMFKMPGR